jgi:hypothetical protein
VILRRQSRRYRTQIRLRDGAIGAGAPHGFAFSRTALSRR